MPVLQGPSSPTHSVDGAHFTSLATPSRGAIDTAVWKVEILPGTPATPHSLTREEIFVVLSGTASVRLAGHEETATVGDAIVVPADVEFELANVGEERLELVCC